MESFHTQTSQIRKLLLSSIPGASQARLRHLALAGCFLMGTLFAWLGMQYQGVPDIKSPLAHARNLAAETFADGRLANPSIPGGEFLQTYLTLQNPAYAAGIPPGEALPLAVGYALGDPLLGLWLGAGGLAFCVAWMIAGWASPRWAILGTAFSVLWLGTFSSWSQSYEGHAAAACGIALAWGAARRHSVSRAFRHSLILALALGWTGLCGPMALLFAAPPVLFLWWRTVRKARLPLPRALLPLFLGLGLAGAVQMTINHAVTGDPLTSPAGLYAEKYDNNPTFLWQRKGDYPRYDFVRMEQYDLLVTEPRSTLATPALETWLKRLGGSLEFYLGVPALLLIVAALATGLTRWGRWYVGAALFTLLSALVVLPYDHGCAAALAALGPLLVVWSARSLLNRRRWRDTVRLRGVLLCGALVGACALARGTALKPVPAVDRHVAYQKELSGYLLNEEGGEHVVVVNYDPLVDPRVEYVYNSAHPENQPIIWARWNDQINGADFFNHFKNRKMWVLWVSPEGMPELRRFQWQTGSASPEPAAVATPDSGPSAATTPAAPTP